MRKIGRRTTCIHAGKLLVGAILVFFGAVGWAQDFPSRQIMIIVPFPAGGGNDLFGRLIGQKLSTAFGRAVIVDNRPGASGNIGTEAVVRSAPDGHTLLYTTSVIATSVALYSKLAFDPQRDLAPVSMTALIPLVLVTHPSLPVRSVKELLALAKSKPGALSYSSGGAASSAHLATELLKLKTGIDANHVPYRGAAPAQTALLSGEVQFTFLVIPLVQGHLKSGKMRALGISTRARSSVLPGVPTLQEAGVADYEALQWHGFFAPVKTPLPIVGRLHGEIVKALAAPEMKERFATEGAEIAGSAPREFATFIQAEVTKWTDVVKRSGAKLD
jgi:tripartite-type tricarboxylate transporter receptor subunit TctC